MSDILLDIKEHQLFDATGYGALSDLLCQNSYNPENPAICLGLDWANRARTNVKANYYVGLKWLEEGVSAIHVRPKVSNLDYMSMFMHCFDAECKDVEANLGKIYGIDFGQKPISVESEEAMLTPLLVIHFLKLTERIVKHGIKSNFIHRQENLNGKIKGKVLLAKTIKRNFSVGRTDRTFCRYQDYCTDCTENQILKRALLFVRKYLSSKQPSCDKDLKTISTYCLGAFSMVSDNIAQQQIKQFKINPLYKDYSDALKVAKLILRRFSYNIDLANKNNDKKLPPFWINMSLLFELYVYSKLKASYHNQISYHISTYGNEIDFVKYDENLIIDTKYIPKWQTEDNHKDVRQLSGYARNYRLRKRIMADGANETTILPCLIIYPGKADAVMFDTINILDRAVKLDTYLKFYKLAIKLPTLL